MGLFDYHIGKNRRHLTFFKIQFFEQVGSEVFCPMGYGEHEVLRDSRVETLQLRYPKAGFRYSSGGNFSEKLEVVRVNLLKHGHRASRPCEVNASGCRVIVDIIGSPHTVQRLHNFSCFRIDYHQLPRFILVSTSNFTSVWFDPAANKQSMMGSVQAGGVWHWAIRDLPLGDHFVFFEINDRDVAIAIYDVSHSDVQFFSGWFEGDARGIATGQLNAFNQFGGFCVNDVDGSAVRLVVVTAIKLGTRRCRPLVRYFFAKDFHCGIKQMRRRIVSSVIRSPLWITIFSQSYDLGYLICRPADSDYRGICQA